MTTVGMARKGKVVTAKGKVTKAERIRSNATKARGLAWKNATNTARSLDQAMEGAARNSKSAHIDATEVAMRLFREFDNWDVNDPKSIKPKAGAHWIAKADKGTSAHTDNEKAVKARLHEIKGLMYDLALLKGHPKPNEPWLATVKEGKALLGGNASLPDFRTSNEKAVDLMKRAYRILGKDQNCNDAGLEIQRRLGLCLAENGVDLTKLNV